jgi:hypothetical protein
MLTELPWLLMMVIVLKEIAFSSMHISLIQWSIYVAFKLSFDVMWLCFGEVCKPSRFRIWMIRYVIVVSVSDEEVGLQFIYGESKELGTWTESLCRKWSMHLHSNKDCQVMHLVKKYAVL